jgi:hypothetical protein
MPVSPVTERLGFTDLVSRLSSEAPRRDRERLLFTDLRPELRASKIGAIRLPRSDGSRLALAAEGLLFGGAAQERTGSSGTGPPETKVEQVGEGEYLVSCQRYYATGSVYADYLSLPVTLGDVPRTVLIESDRPGVELPDDWDGFGQRLTGSGSIVLDRVAITSADAIERPVLDEDQPRYPFTFNQVHLTTVVAGIANRALRPQPSTPQRPCSSSHGTRRRTSGCPSRRRWPPAEPRSPSSHWPWRSSTH